MNKLDALDNIKNIWNAEDINLGDKINLISNCFYSASLDLSGTASYIKATPAELDSLLALSQLDEDIIEKISQINPPKTTWMMFSSASDEEVNEALKVLGEKKANKIEKDEHFTISEFVYQKMLEVNGPTIEQKVSVLSGDDLKHILQKGEDYNVLSEKSKKFLNSISIQKKRGKVLSDKQITWLISILNELVGSGTIKRQSIDGDQEICDRILNAIGK